MTLFEECVSETRLNHVVEKLRSHLRPGSWLMLEGDLGAGKTTLTRKLLELMQGADSASSPTFSLMNNHQMPNGMNLLHLDLYRISRGEEIHFLGFEELFSSKTSYAVFEWPSRLSEDEWQKFFEATGCARPSQVLLLEIEHLEKDERRYRLSQLA